MSTRAAHRIAYELTGKPLMRSERILHAQERTFRPCCNPAHLRKGNAEGEHAGCRRPRPGKRKLDPVKALNREGSTRQSGFVLLSG
jgi:hypothetical protein